MNNNTLQKVYDYLANEWDLFDIPWNPTIIPHIDDTCRKAELTPQEALVVRNAIIGRILDLGEMNAPQLLNLYEKWNSFTYKTDEEETFRCAIICAIRAEFAAFKRA